MRFEKKIMKEKTINILLVLVDRLFFGLRILSLFLKTLIWCSIPALLLYGITANVKLSLHLYALTFFVEVFSSLRLHIVKEEK